MNFFIQALLLWSWQGLLLVGIVALTIRLDRPRSAASRHALWTAGLCIIALLPAADLVMRALPEAPPLVAPISYIAQLPTVALDFSATQTPAASTTAIPQTPGAEAVEPDRPKSWPGLPQIVQWMILGGWAIGALVSLARAVAARFRWRRIIANASEGEADAAPVPVRYSRQVDSPVLVGALRPVILLPYGLESWTDESERRAMIEHELAHVARRDHWLNLLQAAIGAVFFFHPAVRYALRQLELEREIACDERVVAAGISPATYAELILKVAERSINDSHSDCAAFNASAKSLERRINMIFRHSSSAPGNWKLATATKAFLIMGCAVLMLLQTSVMAETPLAGSEFQLAGLQPLTSGMSLMMAAIPKEPAPAAQQAAPPVTTAQAATQVQAPEGGPIVKNKAFFFELFAASVAQQRASESDMASGTVTDPTGAVIPGVQVQLTNLAGDTKSAITNVQGKFAFTGVVPGSYSVRASFPGFGTTQYRLEKTSNPATLDVFMALARMNTSVEITATKPAILLAQTPQTTQPPRPIRVGGDLAAPNLISYTKPQYPAAARAAGIEGRVALLAIIAKDGTITALQPDLENLQRGNTNSELVQAAMDAVKQWRYKPAVLNGQPIEFMTAITVNFSLVEN